MFMKNKPINPEFILLIISEKDIRDFIDTTEQMFEILKKKYDEGKPKCSIIEFTVQECEDLCETIIRKASNIYITRKI